MTAPVVRDERSDDTVAISHIVQSAFHNHPYSNGHEHALVDALRAANALALSLVIEVDGVVVGHCAFSQVTIFGQFCNWYGLGPVAILPAFQMRGLGSLLIREGLARLQAQGAAGCVLLGNPNYYERFGFKARPELVLEGVPAEHFMALSFDGSEPEGIVEFRPEFEEVV